MAKNRKRYRSTDVYNLAMEKLYEAMNVPVVSISPDTVVALATAFEKTYGTAVNMRRM